MKPLNQDAILRFVGVYQNSCFHLAKELQSETAESIDNVIRILEQSTVEGRRNKLALELSAGQSMSKAEIAALEVANLEQAFQLRKTLFENALTVNEVAKLLNVTRQTPHDRLKAGTLLAELDKGELRFPPWQFDSSGPNGVVKGLPELIKALNIPPLGKIAWFVKPHYYLENKTPISVLKHDQNALEALLKLARSVGIF
jgi:hypothetical protein